MATSLDAALARGKIAYEAHLKKTYALHPEGMPMGYSSLNVITRDDFIAHADTCLDFVGNQRVIHILDRDGSVRALLAAHGRPMVSP